ncbi:MAG TPA: large-conductance mechanosensitive channel protein MscL [Gemmata sp.]|nr:large-conductance mechanosensitive channel protein MscL [Gemmata sp.]
MSMYQEFKKFILRGNVVDLAVAVVIGAAFSKIVDSLVKDIFMPIVGVLTGGLDVSGLTVTLYGDAKLGYGNFLQAIINFVIVGFCMFLVVKAINRLQATKAAQAAPPPEPTPSEKLLAEIRDILKSRQDQLPPPTPGV